MHIYPFYNIYSFYQFVALENLGQPNNPLVFFKKSQGAQPRDKELQAIKNF